ncbi:MAG: hypothetical protein Q4D86_08370 [Pasteurella oralis]|nr:hypothetical protein [Pasteurella oralis]
MALDIAKVAILACPVILYGEYPLIFKIVNITLLFFVSYTALGGSRFLRRYKATMKNDIYGEKTNA